MIIQIKPTKKQYKAYQYLNPSYYGCKYIAFGGGAGGAKSWLGCEWLLQMCYIYPGTKYFIGRNELKRIMQSTYIGTYSLVTHSLEGADVVIEPHVAHIGAGDFHHAQECILQGELAAQASIREIKRKLGNL